MRFTTKVTSLVAAGGAAALGIGLLAFSPGVGAAFTDSATGNASIAVGTFGCELSSTDNNVTISTDHHTATVDLGTIQSSAPGSMSVPLTVTNTGSMPVATSWSGSISGGNLTSAFSPVPAAASSILIASGDSQTVNIGFNWTELTNTDRGRSGSAKYTVNCSETGFTLFEQDGGTATWDGSNQSVTLVIPDASGPDGAGINVVAPGSALPSTAPAFTTDVYGAGTPRWSIVFSNGKVAYGYPAQDGSAWNVPGSGANVTWQSVQSYASTNRLTVSNAFVVADTSHGVQTAQISCVDYSGTPLFGTGC